MTRFEKKEELIGLFSSGSILIGDMLDEAMDFAEKNIEKEATRKIVECSEFLAKLPHWISVEDELPKEDGTYLFYDAESQGAFVSYFWADLTLNENISHWMRIKKPTENRKGEQNNG